MDFEEKETVLEEFNKHVNMGPNELENWLKSRKSREASLEHDGTLSLYQTGQKVLEIQRKPAVDLADEDFDHMRRAIGFIKRRQTHVPFGYLNNTHWRYSLMALGHDPLKNS